MPELRTGGFLLLALAMSGCAGAGPEPAAVPAAATSVRSTDTLPRIPAVRGALRLDVVYPSEGAALTTRARNFIFGSTGTGAASLRINGVPVEVAPNGAFLGFLPVPADGVYRLEAAAGEARASLVRTVRLPPAAAAGGAIDTATASPRGVLTLTEGERLTVRFRGTPGGTARLVLPDGSVIAMHESAARDREAGFAQDADAGVAAREYVGEFLVATPFQHDPASRHRLAGARTGTRPAVIELTHGSSTSRAPLPLSLALLPAGGGRRAVVATERPDGQLLAAAVPGGGAPLGWSFPNATHVGVDGEAEGALRIRLTRDLAVWADARGLRLEPGPAPRGDVGAVRVTGAAEWVDVRLVTSEPLPVRVSAEGSDLTVEVYGARSRTNWLYYGPEDPLVRRIAWEQPRDDLYRLRLELARPAWGWLTFRDSTGALVVRVRRAPRIRPERPLEGIHVAVDAGHPPLGATGPTRLAEADANLAVARRLAALLRDAGARVTETRPGAEPVELGLRPVLAERAGAHLLVSIHNNAFPDGVDPFANNGTTVFYNAPPSLGLARAVQRELVSALGLRDLGIGLADLALVRPTWMPSVLSESMFMMIPRQEAALRDPAVQDRIARAHLRGIEAFLREAADRIP